MSKDNLFSYNHFRSASAWLIFILGIVLYGIGFFACKSTSIWKEIFIKAGDVLVIGVMIGYLSNAAQFLGVFKQDLQDIIYGKEFLRQRKDINVLWDTVSKEMFRNKFPQIHKDFLKAIKNYFPSDEVSYYNDYETNISIEWIDKDNGQVKVIHNVSFELITDDKDAKFDYPLKTWTRIREGAKFTDELTEIKVNGKIPPIIEKGEKKVDDSNICKEQTVELSGNYKYSIEYTRKKEYSLYDDYSIGLRSKYIVNGLRVNIEFPEDIDVTFLCRGTQEDFEDVKHSKGRIEKKYKGIILPRQGYIFALRKK